MLGMNTVPCLRLEHLSAIQKTALALADNKIGDMSDFDPDKLAMQLAQLCAVEFNVEITGFETAEVDILLEPRLMTGAATADPADVFSPADHDAPAVSRLGDCWLLGNHQLYCGNSLHKESYEEVLGQRRAAMVITDPPFNVPIQGHVSGLGKAAHREFAMASGEMSPEEFIKFLRAGMDLMVRFSTDGSLHFIFMDWRHVGEITTAGAAARSTFAPISLRSWRRLSRSTRAARLAELRSNEHC
jgi:hypothetical protein